jgi:ribosomal protein S18 acetylase RimI-like enzyme
VEYYAFCAVDEHEDVRGYICFGPIPMTDGCYDLYWIAVDGEFAGRGIGGRLMRFAEEFLEGKGARRIYVDTSSTPGYQPARALYKKHGYRRVCCLSDFYRLGDGKYIYMKEIGKEGRQVL